MSGGGSRWAGAAAILAGVAVAVAGSVTIARAAGEGPMGEGFGKHHGRMGFGRMMHRRVLRHLDLTDEQRAQIKEVLRAQREGMREQRQSVEERRRALHEAIRSGAEEWELRDKASDLGVATGDLAVTRAAVHSQMQAILTDEQRQKAEGLRTKVHERMNERRERKRERMLERHQDFGGDRPFLDTPED